MNQYRLLVGDCLSHMASIRDASIDLVCADLPYGTTQCAWDTVIPFTALWQAYWRIAKPNAAIVLTASQPFTSALVMSQIAHFKYSWHWDKVNGIRNHLNAKHQPMRKMEDVLVFYKHRPTYNAQMREGEYVSRKTKPGQSEGFGKVTGVDTGRKITELYPIDLLSIKSHDPNNSEHPTQKPVELMRYMVRTYTNPNAIVLDNTMGVGTTGVACMLEHRHFIGIELSPEYVQIAARRIKEVCV